MSRSRLSLEQAKQSESISLIPCCAPRCEQNPTVSVSSTLSNPRPSIKDKSKRGQLFVLRNSYTAKLAVEETGNNSLPRFRDSLSSYLLYRIVVPVDWARATSYTPVVKTANAHPTLKRNLSLEAMALHNLDLIRPNILSTAYTCNQQNPVRSYSSEFFLSAGSQRNTTLWL